MKVFELLESETQGALSGLLTAIKAELKAGGFGQHVRPKTMSAVKDNGNEISFTIKSSSNRFGEPMTTDEEVEGVLNKVVKSTGLSGPLYGRISFNGAPRSKKRDQRGKIDGPAKLNISISTEKPAKINVHTDDNWVSKPGRKFTIK